MEIKKTLEIKAKLETLLSQRAADLEAVKKEILADNEAAKKAEAALEAATRKNDIEAYQKAKASKLKAEDSSEMHSAIADTLSHKELISEADYTRLADTVLNEAKNLELEAQKNLLKLAGEMKSLGVELEEAQTTINDILSLLQHDVYRDADRRIKDRRPINPSDKLQVNFWDTIWLAQSAVNSHAYKDITEGKK